jgi:hypothetical protein
MFMEKGKLDNVSIRKLENCNLRLDLKRNFVP